MKLEIKKGNKTTFADPVINKISLKLIIIILVEGYIVNLITFVKLGLMPSGRPKVNIKLIYFVQEIPNFCILLYCTSIRKNL